MTSDVINFSLSANCTAVKKQVKSNVCVQTVWSSHLRFRQKRPFLLLQAVFLYDIRCHKKNEKNLFWSIAQELIEGIKMHLPAQVLLFYYCRSSVCRRFGRKSGMAENLFNIGYYKTAQILEKPILSERLQKKSPPCGTKNFKKGLTNEIFCVIIQTISCEEDTQRIANVSREPAGGVSR